MEIVSLKVSLVAFGLVSVHNQLTKTGRSGLRLKNAPPFAPEHDFGERGDMEELRQLWVLINVHL